MADKSDDILKKEALLVRKVREGDEEAFEELFFEYYYPLCSFALKITRSREMARDTVQDVFYKIWRGREDWEVTYSLKVYLFQAVRNQALNLLDKKRTRQDYTDTYAEEKIIEYPSLSPSPDSEGYSTELVRRIWELVEKMPERRKMVFELHRRHGLSYREISDVMEIARKTVENHMGQALQFLRDNIDPEIR